MSPDPEKPIEGLLRQYARQRRERARESWTVHPVTRRLLQQEVARRFPKQRTFGSRLREFSRSRWLKPLLAVAGATAVIVVAFVLTVGPNGGRRDKSTTYVASSKSASVSAKDQLSGANGTGDAKQFFAVADNSPGQPRDRALREGFRSLAAGGNGPAQEKQEASQATSPALTLAENKKAQAVPAPAEVSVAQDGAAPSGAAAASGISSSLAVSAQNNPGQSTQPASQSAPESLASFAVGKSDLALGGPTSSKAVVMRYGLFNASQTSLVVPTQREALTRGVQVRSFLAAQPQLGNEQRVLTSFNLEQTGRELRVIDSDGSVYTGLMLPTNAPAVALNQDRRLVDRAVSNKAGQSSVAAQESEAPQQGSSFQLTGTNRTLNRRVVFAGVLTTNQAATANQAIVLGRSLAQTAREQSDAFSVSRTNQNVQDIHLSGTAQIDGEPPVRIEASPVNK